MGYFPDRDKERIAELASQKADKAVDAPPVGAITISDVLPVEPWERQPEETGPAFAAFQVYRDLGPERTIANTRRAMKSDAETKAGGMTLGAANGKLQKWAYKYNWEVRALAYDKMIDKKRVDENVEAALEMTRRHIQVSMMIQEKGVKRLEKMKDAEIAKMKPLEAAKLIDQGVDMERLARGQPTSQSKQVHTGKVEHATDKKELGEFKKELLGKLEDLERKRTGTEQIIRDHKTPAEEADENNGTKHVIRPELLPQTMKSKNTQLS
jgi:hypothetical protein